MVTMQKLNEKSVKDALKLLNFHQQKKFGFFCIDRIIHLYEDVDSRINISEMDKKLKDGDAYDTIKSIYEILKKKSSISLEELIDLRNKSDSLILDTDNIYESTTENVIAKIVAECLYTFLNFMITSEIDYIFDCARLIIDIINAQISDYYFLNVCKNEDKCNHFLETLFDNEYTIELQATKFLSENNYNKLSSLLEETFISANPVITIENLRKKF